MNNLFLTVLNMSLTASYVILFVILVRLFFKKAPKVISYSIWSVVAFRLINPISFESLFSLIPKNIKAVSIPQDIIYQQSPQINSGIGVVDSLVKETLPTSTSVASATISPLQNFIHIGAWVWLIGIIAMLSYSLISILILKRQLKSAQYLEKNIFEAKNIKTPFVFGLVRPKIYLPVTLYAEERSYILLHEHTHIHRKDNIVKVLAFLILSVHWFNPLVWVAFMLMSTDMELSCDESVLRKINKNMKKPYANSLLSLATGRHVLNGCPIAFGEGNVKGRVKNVLNYRKPSFWIMIIAAVTVVVLCIGLLANPKEKDTSNNSEKLITYEFSNLRYGQVQYRMSPLSHDNAKLAEAAIRDYMIKSDAWPGIDINRIETSYLIHSTTYDGKTSDYYVFMLGHEAVLQQGEKGQYRIIDKGLNKKLTQLISGKLSSAGGVDESQNISLIWNYNPYFGHLFPALPIEFDLPYNKVNVTVNNGSLYLNDYPSNIDIHYDKELTMNINQSLLWTPF